MALLHPFSPIRVTQEGLKFRVDQNGRSVLIGANGWPESIIANGQELLASPIRLVGEEDGEKIEWFTDYEENESEAFIQSRNEEDALICGAMRSRRFIVDTCVRANYDGSLRYDMKLMPAGLTVAECFGVAQARPYQYIINHLYLEIPLKADLLKQYSMYPNSDIETADGEVIQQTRMTNSGKVLEKDMYLPFKALLWLGQESCGLGWYAENFKNWEIADEKHTLEILHQGDVTVLRVHLLDHQPASWDGNPEEGRVKFAPLSYHFGFIGTPLKEFPKNPLAHHSFHIDCFVKIKGNYYDFFANNQYFDRLKEKGVDTLILHEKWNKSQNFFDLSEYTENQIKKIVEECHKRGIRVLTYFGYEVSAMAYSFSDIYKEVRNEQLVDGKQSFYGGWYRVPFQRDNGVCYNSSYKETFLKGVAKIMDTCHTDGLYLDGTARPLLCYNEKHGCGWRDLAGNLHGTYPVEAVQELFREMYNVVHSRGGEINVHCSGYVNFTALPYIDMCWYGEHLQFDYIKGEFADVPLDYFQAEYTGRNMGVPVEFIAYENRPIWNFENAFAISIVHGIVPRPNDIDYPLEFMSGIWKILDRFPIAQSEWKPYWRNGASTTAEKVKTSYYKYTDVSGKDNLLVFVSNTSCKPAENVQVQLAERAYDSWKDITDGTVKDFENGFSLAPYTCKILYIS